MGAVALIIVALMGLVFVFFVVLIILGLFADRHATRNNNGNGTD